MGVTKFTYTRQDATKAWDISDLVTEISWATDLDFSAGTLEFSALDYGGDFKAHIGDFIDFQWNGQPVYKGRTFKVALDSKEKFNVLTYDNLRYLKNEDVLVFPISSCQERFETVMQRLADYPYKSVGSDTYKLPEKVYDGNTYFDMLGESFKQNRAATGVQYFVRDNYGTVEFLCAGANTQTDLLLGDSSMTMDWSFERSSDESYNVIKVVRENDTEGEEERKTYTIQTANSDEFIRRFGKLQKIERASDNKANEAQLQAQAEQLLSQLQDEKRNFTFTALGDLRMRAGTGFWFEAAALDAIGLKRSKVIAENVTHHFGTKWTMDVTGRFI